jgi:dihydrofolate reductase
MYRRSPQVNIKASVFIATSLDGFIARENGDLDWLTGAQSASTEQDYGYQDFMDAVDTVVMGRNTFELASTFAAWPYGGKRVVVLSSRPSAVPPHLADGVEWLSMPPRRLVEWLAARGAAHLYVDGGKTIQGFLGADLIATRHIPSRHQAVARIGNSRSCNGRGGRRPGWCTGWCTEPKASAEPRDFFAQSAYLCEERKSRRADSSRCPAHYE